MEQVSLAVNQIVILGLIVLTGYITGKRQWLPENARTVISQLIVKITLPSMILTTMSNYNFSNKMLMDGAWMFILAILFFAFGFAVAAIMSKTLKLHEDTANIYKLQSILGNIGFLAFPIINSLYGEKGILYSIFYLIVNDCAIWTVGVYFLNRHNSDSKNVKSNIKHFINPNTISFLIGIFLIIINFRGLVERSDISLKAYTLFYDTFNPLGKTTSYLAMLFIGLILSEVKIRSFSELLKRYPIFVLTVTKMLLVPTCALILLTLTGGIIDPFVINIIVLLLGMPSASLIPVLASQFKTDYKFAAETVFVTTVSCMLTIPCMLFIIKLFNL